MADVDVFNFSAVAKELREAAIEIAKPEVIGEDTPLSVLVVSPTARVKATYYLTRNQRGELIWAKNRDQSVLQMEIEAMYEVVSGKAQVETALKKLNGE